MPTMSTMRTLAERLTWVVDHTGPDGWPWTRRGLSAAAGLSQSHIGQILRGTVTGQAVSRETISGIARATGVNPTWLWCGDGDPLENVDPFPARALAARLAREADVSEQAVEAVISEPLTPEREAWPTLRSANKMQLRDVERQRQTLRFTKQPGRKARGG